jgi:hypothetical protein
VITSKTDDSIRFRRTDKSEIKVQADGYGLAVTVTDPDGLVAYYPLTPSDTAILHQFLGEALPMWDKDEI